MGSTLTVAKAYLTAFAAKDIDKLEGFFADKFRFDGPMMQFDSADAFTGMLRELDSRDVVPKELWIVAVSLALVQITEELAKTLLVWNPRLIAQTQSPFAEQPRFVARFLQHHRHRYIFRLQRVAITLIRVTAYTGMSGMQALHQT